MAEGATYQKLTVEVRRNEEQGQYQFGVVIDGVFVVFAGRKLGGVDSDLAAAALEGKRKSGKSSGA